MKFITLNVSSNKRWGDPKAGFTLIEMLVVAAITGFITTALVVNFSRTRFDMTRNGNFALSVIRQAQTQAVSSAKYNNYNPCGYGIHYIDANHFATYVGPNAGVINCSTIDRNYQAGEDTLLKAETFDDTAIKFIGPFNDIYFEPPDPKTYLNNNASLNQPPISITIGKVGECPQNCKTIYVYPSGKIELQ